MSKIAEVAGIAEDVEYYKASVLALFTLPGFCKILTHPNSRTFPMSTFLSGKNLPSPVTAPMRN